MVQAAVFLVEDASPNSITTFHDLISNEIPKILGRWSLELKIFKSNNQTNIGDSSRFLHEVSFDHEPGTTITLVNKSALVTTTNTPKSLIDSGANGSNESFDQILQTKLQSLWLLRQTLKGDNGNSYEIHSGKFIIRTINVFLHGTFKAFLIEIQYHGNDNGQKEIEDLVNNLNFPKGKLSAASLNEKPSYLVDLAFQYTQALQL